MLTKKTKLEESVSDSMSELTSAERIVLIKNFAEKYTQEREVYKEAVEYVARVLEETLNKTGLPSIITRREKSPDSLKRKLLKRVNEKAEKKEKAYNKVEDIEEDIVDLLGIRVALYSPHEQDHKIVKSVIGELFTVNREVVHPKQSDEKEPHPKRFQGYAAKHYRVSWKDMTPKMSLGVAQVLQKTPVEIQVATLLMHAWSEVEHDLGYKLANGKPSQAESAVLETLNGLVHTGEAMLEQLRGTTLERVERENKTFRDHFQLATFLRDRFPEQTTNVLDYEDLYVIVSILRLTPNNLKTLLDEVTRNGTTFQEANEPWTLAMLLGIMNADVKDTLRRKFDEIPPKHKSSIGRTLMNMYSLEIESQRGNPPESLKAWEEVMQKANLHAMEDYHEKLKQHVDKWVQGHKGST